MPRFQHTTIESTMSRLRYISIISVIASGLGSVLMFIIGAYKVGLAYFSYFSGGITHDPELSATRAITYLIQAVDAFLIALVLMIFSGGVYNLFVHRIASTSEELNSWVRVKNISQLKKILAELVIVILIVKFMEGGLRLNLSAYTWEMLVLPIGIVMLAIALKLMELDKRD